MEIRLGFQKKGYTNSHNFKVNQSLLINNLSLIEEVVSGSGRGILINTLIK